MLYTVLPVPNSPSADTNVRDVYDGNRWLRVEIEDHGEGVIRSILSSNPRDYLNPSLQPGTRVPLSALGIA